MDYKAEYERITGRKWPFDWEPADMTEMENAAFFLALFGNPSVTSTPENVRQWVWRAPTKKELKRIIREGGPKSFTVEREQ